MTIMYFSAQKCGEQLVIRFLHYAAKLSLAVLAFNSSCVLCLFSFAYLRTKKMSVKAFIKRRAPSKRIAFLILFIVFEYAALALFIYLIRIWMP